jgi:hypothetical protein
MQQSTKTRALLIAGAAVVAAGVFGTAMGAETAAGGPAAPAVLSDMTLGATATTTSDVPTVLPTPMAAPALKATVPCGFTSGC